MPLVAGGPTNAWNPFAASHFIFQKVFHLVQFPLPRFYTYKGDYWLVFSVGISYPSVYELELVRVIARGNVPMVDRQYFVLTSCCVNSTSDSLAATICLGVIEMAPMSYP